MTITSPAFTNNGTIPPSYSCEGDNTNPPLEIADVPAETTSLALSVEDPDSPGGTWQHWLVWGIDPSTTTINPAEVPSGASEGMTDFGRSGYGGPCPASGVHHYVFRLYALDINPLLDQTTDRAAFDQAIKEHILAQAELVGRFGHSQNRA